MHMKEIFLNNHALCRQARVGRACLHYCDPHLFCEAEYLEQDLPSQAQYGSLARQQSAQASPYTSQRWRARWVTPKTDPTYSCCYIETHDTDRSEIHILFGVMQNWATGNFEIFNKHLILIRILLLTFFLWPSIFSIKWLLWYNSLILLSWTIDLSSFQVTYPFGWNLHGGNWCGNLQWYSLKQLENEQIVSIKNDDFFYDEIDRGKGEIE